jgi:hypothetical protein
MAGYEAAGAGTFVVQLGNCEDQSGSLKIPSLFQVIIERLSVLGGDLGSRTHI